MKTVSEETFSVFSYKTSQLAKHTSIIIGTLLEYLQYIIKRKTYLIEYIINVFVFALSYQIVSSHIVYNQEM